MKNKRLIELLSRFHPEREVKFATGPLTSLDVLSIYTTDCLNDPRSENSEWKDKGKNLNKNPVWVDIGDPDA